MLLKLALIRMVVRIKHSKLPESANPINWHRLGRTSSFYGLKMSHYRNILKLRVQNTASVRKWEK